MYIHFIQSLQNISQDVCIHTPKWCHVVVARDFATMEVTSRSAGEILTLAHIYLPLYNFSFIIVYRVCYSNVLAKYPT